MRSVASLTLIVSVVSLVGVTATAQNRMDDATADPIGRALAHEAVRLAAVPQSQPAGSNWSRVRTLAPGTEVVVTVQGLQPVKRDVVAVDESNLTVANLTNPTLPAEKIARNDVVEIKTATVRRRHSRRGEFSGLSAASSREASFFPS